MSTALRLNNKLVREAEAEGQVFKRSAPKQIEYWAEIGKAISQVVSSNDVLALTQGLAQVRIEMAASNPVDPDAVFARIDQQRTNSQLGATVTRAAVVYEASRTQAGFLDRINPDGSRDTGHFHNGLFTPIK